tara:strand:- start:213 stop:368 length:156 start_codon:yes stop_codon:yes gene_type:complete
MSMTKKPVTLFDNFTRHSSEGVAFRTLVEEVRFKPPVAERDSDESILGGQK